jgi:hypothetical protein
MTNAYLWPVRTGVATPDYDYASFLPYLKR